jgi:antigen flippase
LAAGRSYGQILKSSALVGGSSPLNVLIGMVRTKVMAVLLGIFGVYGAIATLTQTVAGMGVSSSGVRQIAEAPGTGDAQRIASTTVVLLRLSLVLGLIGTALMINPVSIEELARIAFEHRPFCAKNCASLALRPVSFFVAH